MSRLKNMIIAFMVFTLSLSIGPMVGNSYAGEEGITDEVTTTESAIEPLALAPLLGTKGNVAVGGSGMRGTGAGTITISGIPAGAKIKKAFLYWAILDSTTNAGMFDATAITGTVLGTGVDPCWSETSSTAYRADVKAIVKARNDPNGAYSLAGFPDSGTQGAGPETEGATLVIVWKKKGVKKNLVLIRDGFFVNTLSNTIFSTTFPFVKSNGKQFQAKDPVSAHFTMIGGDGQSSGADTLFNSTTVGTNNWDSSDGPMWETDTFDVSALVSAGDTSATASINTGGDCLIYVAAVLEVKAKKVPAP